MSSVFYVFWRASRILAGLPRSIKALALGVVLGIVGAFKVSGLRRDTSSGRDDRWRYVPASTGALPDEIDSELRRRADVVRKLRGW